MSVLSCGHAMIDMSVARDDRYDALVQKDRSHRLSIRFLMFDSCLLFVSPILICVPGRICARSHIHGFSVYFARFSNQNMS